MKRQSKLTPQEQQQLAAEPQHIHASGAQEFATVEDMLRQDASNTPVPPTVAQRLEESVKQLPPPSSRAWWRRFFGG
jgi:hypothetical protein